ncbi:MAG TPA: helix-turn-helix domain-containing protein [Methanomassiliicoccales archaeon]|nr:helix-turn-helix domain-containing protein [Methanomassiliicoccales archaeon]
MMEAGADKGLSTPSSFSYGRGDKMKVELDKKALFALASDSRMEILKALHPQRRTVAQLADQLSIDKAAVHRHLKKLEEGELVNRYEDHGFVYYGLSWKARDVVSPGENTKIIIVFSLTLMLIVGAFAAILSGLPRYVSMSGGEPSSQSPIEGAGKYLGGYWASPELMVLGIALLVVAAVLIYFGWRRLRAPKQKTSSSDGSKVPTKDEATD